MLLLEGLRALAERLLGQPALGLGDAKLAAQGGAWLGPREPFLFGPFIAPGIWLVWLTGPQWWWSTWLMLLGA